MALGSVTFAAGRTFVYGVVKQHHHVVMSGTEGNMWGNHGSL